MLSNIAIIFVIILSIWIGWIFLFEKASYKKGILKTTTFWKSASINIDNLSIIKYHYHAVVGFISVWEFIDDQGKSLEINGRAIGLNKVLSQLDNTLSGFSMTRFKQQFESGDVEDTLDVWSSQKHDN